CDYMYWIQREWREIARAIEGFHSDIVLNSLDNYKKEPWGYWGAVAPLAALYSLVVYYLMLTIAEKRKEKWEWRTYKRKRVFNLK
ncbi:MAG: hypothetical protein WC455_25945, partial [Dehalococcoidia bacterium]